MTGVFTPLTGTIWGLGSYDNPDVQFNGIDATGVEWVLAKVDGWKTTTANTPIIRADGGDGGWFAPGTIAPRVLTLTGAFRGCSTAQLDAAETQLRAALERTATDQTLWVGGMGATRALQASVRLTGDVLVDDTGPNVRTFSAVLTAADPYKYAAGTGGVLTGTTGLAPTQSAGMTFPVSFPLDFGGADPTSGRMALTNPGSKPVFPVVRFTGPGSGLTVHHLESGFSAGYTPDLLAGSAVTLDFAARTLVDSGGRSLYTSRTPGTVFFPLLPGLNTVSFTADDYDPAPRVIVSYRPRWT